VARGKIANAVLKEALSFFDTGGEIAIFDSSNASKDRRAMLSESVHAHGEATGRPIAIVFVESILTSPTLLLANMKAKVRASPDFYALHEPAAMESLKQRIVHYERDYESCSEEEGPYIKLFDLSSKAHAPHPARASPHLLSAHNPPPPCSPTPSPGKVEASHIYGRVSSSVLPYLLSITFVARPVALVSVPDNDDTGNFAAALAAWAEDHAGPLQVISSTHPAAMAAAARVAQAKEAQSPSHGRKTAFACDEHGERGWPASSCPRNAACHDMSTTCPVGGGEQGLASVGPPIHFAELLPSSLGSGDSPPTSFEERAALGAGTSPKDLVRRLEPSVLELEKRLAPLLVVAHAAPCRALRAYLLGLLQPREPLRRAVQWPSARENRRAAAGVATRLLLGRSRRPRRRRHVARRAHAVRQDLWLCREHRVAGPPERHRGSRLRLSTHSGPNGTCRLREVVGALLAEHDTELTQNHSGRKGRVHR